MTELPRDWAGPAGPVRVAGPAGALVGTLARLGWARVGRTQLRDDLGRLIDLALDPPAAVGRWAKQSVRRWQARPGGLPPTISHTCTSFIYRIVD